MDDMIWEKNEVLYTSTAGDSTGDTLTPLLGCKPPARVIDRHPETGASACPNERSFGTVQAMRIYLARAWVNDRYLRASLVLTASI